MNGEYPGLPNIFASGFIDLPIQTWPGLEKHHRELYGGGVKIRAQKRSSFLALLRHLILGYSHIFPVQNGNILSTKFLSYLEYLFHLSFFHVYGR